MGGFLGDLVIAGLPAGEVRLVLQPAPPLSPWAGREDKALVAGFEALRLGQSAAAVDSLALIVEGLAEPRREPGVSLIFAIANLAIGNVATACEVLLNLVEYVEGEPAADLPDERIRRLRLLGDGTVSIPGQGIALPIPGLSYLSAPFLLVFSLEKEEQVAGAEQVLRQVQELSVVVDGAGDPDEFTVAALTDLLLAQMQARQNRWQDVIQTTNGYEVGRYPWYVALGLERAAAMLHLGLPEASLTLCAQALSWKGQDEWTRRYGSAKSMHLQARYITALCYEAQGKMSVAQREFQQIYAEDSTYKDVAARLQAAPR